MRVESVATGGASVVCAVFCQMRGEGGVAVTVDSTVAYDAVAVTVTVLVAAPVAIPVPVPVAATVLVALAVVVRLFRCRSCRQIRSFLILTIMGAVYSYISCVIPGCMCCAVELLAPADRARHAPEQRKEQVPATSDAPGGSAVIRTNVVHEKDVRKSPTASLLVDG